MCKRLISDLMTRKLTELCYRGQPLVGHRTRGYLRLLARTRMPSLSQNFLENVLSRNNIDNKGGPINSSINCVVASESPDNKQWSNSFWSDDQKVAVFGHNQDDQGNLISRAANLDVVGHEIFHGVTASEARLELAGEAGALNESYSDVFGVIIANSNNPDMCTWNWEFGGRRDMRDPSRFGQPASMRDFAELPLNNDLGGVHTNSGIHNRAASILTSEDSAHRLLFKPEEVAAVFYYALTEHLGRTSRFSDSRRAVILSALTVFRTLPSAQLRVKLSAIKEGFSAVGISE